LGHACQWRCGVALDPCDRDRWAPQGPWESPIVFSQDESDSSVLYEPARPQCMIETLSIQDVLPASLFIPLAVTTSHWMPQPPIGTENSKLWGDPEAGASGRGPSSRAALDGPQTTVIFGRSDTAPRTSPARRPRRYRPGGSIRS